MENSEILISIIIPIYNCELYLRECLDSVIKQTIENKEIICIDDGSTDSSLAIVEEYAEKYSYFTMIKQENQGAGKARNKGILIALGEYISFLDADDYYNETDALEKMLNCCKEKSLFVCGGLRKMIQLDGRMIEEETHRETVKGKSNGVLIEYSEYQDDFHYQNYIYNKEFLVKNKIFFPDYRRYQDPPFFLDVMIKVQKFWVLPVELYCYRLGHQKFLLQSSNIVYTLRGIKDNLKKANKYGYDRLKERLISRINGMYYEYILHNFNKTTILELLEIEQLLYGTKLEVKPLHELEKYNEIKWEYQFLCTSYGILDSILRMKKQQISLDDILITNGYKNIAVYGLGKYGRILVDELIGSKVNILSVIDKNVTEYAGLTTCKINEVPDDIDLIVVTPIKYVYEIIDDIRAYHTAKILRFEEVIWLLNDVLDRAESEN